LLKQKPFIEPEIFLCYK